MLLNFVGGGNCVQRLLHRNFFCRVLLHTVLFLQLGYNSVQLGYHRIKSWQRMGRLFFKYSKCIEMQLETPDFTEKRKKGGDASTVLVSYSSVTACLSYSISKNTCDFQFRARALGLVSIKND